MATPKCIILSLTWGISTFQIFHRLPKFHQCCLIFLGPIIKFRCLKCIAFQRFRYNFIVKDWLSLTQGDGQVERVVPIAGDENLKEKDRLFAAWTRAKLFDDVCIIQIVTYYPNIVTIYKNCCLGALYFPKVKILPSN